MENQFLNIVSAKSYVEGTRQRLRGPTTVAPIQGCTQMTAFVVWWKHEYRTIHSLCDLTTTHASDCNALVDN